MILHQNLCGIRGILRTFHTVKTWFLFIWFAYAQHFWCSMVSVSWTIAQYTTSLNSISLPHRMTLKACSLWQVSSTLCNQSSRYQICWILFRQIYHYISIYSSSLLWQTLAHKEYLFGVGWGKKNHLFIREFAWVNCMCWLAK